jgi:toxin ParE1/3/4
MSIVTFHPAARADLNQIWRDLAVVSNSFDIADRFADAVYDTCLIYANQPLTGQLRTELASLIRCFTVKKYVVFYVPSRQGIEVIQIIHGSRDIAAHFRGYP